MIESLHGQQETVNFKNRALLVPYDNHEFECYPLHWHTPIEIIMPIESGYPVICNGITYDLRERDILIIQPGVLHSMPAVQGRRYILQASLLPIFSSTMSPFIYPFLPSALMLTQERDKLLYTSVRDLIHSIYHEQAHLTQTSELSMYISLLQILLLISNAVLQTQTNEESRQSEHRMHFHVLQNICEYINCNYASNITLDEIAERSGFNKYYINRQFKTFTGETIYKYLSRIRIKNADLQLVGDKTSITEIACNTGFYTTSSFIRMFRKFHNCTPSEYRSMYMKLDHTTPEP